MLQCAVTGDTSTTVGEGGTSVPAASTTPGDTTPGSSVAPTATTVPTPTDTATAATPAGFRGVAPTDAPSTTAAPTATTAVPGSDVPTTTAAAPTATTAPISDPNDPAAPGQQEVLPVRGDTGEVCIVGPSGGSGEVFVRGSAEPSLDQVGAWGVTVDLRSDGEAAWNLLASQCNQGASSCPSRQLAIVLDDIIQSAPTVNEPFFSGSVQITGSFSEGEARSLARVLNRGAFPVNVEAQSVQTVSPTLGGDSLEAAVISGIVGAMVIVLFMIAYYRKLAVVIIAGLIVWGMTVYVASALVSQWTNYAFTLGGATGIIVAIGVTVDSYVVFFERLKDEVRAGRALRNAAPRAFKLTWRTIVSADVVAFLGSAILFWLSVGSVKGFALYLGLTTICDMLVCYFFTRPAVFLISRSGWFDDGPALGLGTRRRQRQRHDRHQYCSDRNGVESADRDRIHAKRPSLPGPDLLRLLRQAARRVHLLCRVARGQRSVARLEWAQPRHRLRRRHRLGRPCVVVHRSRTPKPFCVTTGSTRPRHRSKNAVPTAVI